MKKNSIYFLSSLLFCNNPLFEKAISIIFSKDDFFKIIAKSVGRSLDIYLKAINAEDADDVEDDETLLKIGALADKAGETVATIRFWTKEGLLEIAETTKSNYALYSIEMIERCEEIQNLKAERYTLAEIRDRLNSAG